MEKRDYLKDQTEQLGKVLAKILAGLLRINSTGETSDRVEISNRRLKSELDIDLNELLEFDKNDLKKYLTDRKLSAEQIELLSKYLEEIGLMGIAEKELDGIRYLKKAVTLVELSDEISNILSVERFERKKNLEKIIRQADLWPR